MKKINDYPSYKESPIELKGVGTKTYVIEGDIEEFVSTGTGEASLYKKLGSVKSYTHDSLEYRKLYVRGLPLLKDLSSPGLKVFSYILMYIRPKQSEVIISIPECIEFTGYSGAVNIYKGIIELLEKEIIFRKVGSGGVYFINSNILFNGKRV